ncbi:hypothetical protein KR044_003707 [Drosophila immigrans]|nr:hypothetical protein KR044_003707 [Drosophila immigrans]
MPEIRKHQNPPTAMGLARPQKPSKSPQEKRIALITAMGHFRPKNATPIQFYNYVREFCIMHNCSIDEAMERAPSAWTQLSQDQRQLYKSEMHAALPIPVPSHLVYRAIQMERAGRWKLSAASAGKGGSPTYSVESYAPPTKPTRLQTRIRAQQPRYDNLAETSPCCLCLDVAATRRPRTLTPPQQRAQRAQLEKQSQSLSNILSAVSVKQPEEEEEEKEEGNKTAKSLGKMTLPISTCMRKRKGKRQTRGKEPAETVELRRQHGNKKKHKKNKKL